MNHAYQQYIVCDPAILLGKPTIQGTRVPVELILDLLAKGATYEEVLTEYPDLTRQDILAVLDYACATVKAEEIYHVETVAV